MKQSNTVTESDSIFRKVQWSHWFVITAVATVVTGRWLWATPHGFPVSHPRTLANLVFPFLAFMGFLSASIACGKRKPIAVALTAALPAIGLGLALGCLVLYPRSMMTLKIAILATGLAYLQVSYSVFWWTVGKGIAAQSSLALFTAFMTVGICWAATQRAALPSTVPLNVPLPSVPAIAHHCQPSSSHFRNGSSQLYVQPFLEFHSLSPDRFWTLFAPKRSDAWVPETTYSELQRDENNTLTTWCQLEADNYSHLNSFTQLEFSTTGKLSVSFSPCPDERITIHASDYPYGNPARFAYLGADSMFHIVEASSGEKGPFTELASAPCDRNHALEVTLYSNQQPVFVIRFDDFLTQCSLDLSPTAGWGVPQNSIQFSLADDDPETAYLFFSLASTSVGMGFDSVGHQRDTYRNRMTVNIKAP